MAGKRNMKKVSNNRSTRNTRGKQGRKDSKVPRVNYDNAREDKFERDIKEGMKAQNANDISEVFNSSQTSKSAATLPFASIIGQNMTVKAARGGVEGVLIFPWSPNWGIGRSKTVLNKAFQQVYSFIVHGNSRNYSYEYTDVAIYSLAAAEVFTAISEAIRVYGLAKAYSEENLYYGDGLIAAAGFKPDDIRRNLGQMWFDINNLIMQTRQLWFPDVFPILKRWIRMSSDVYTDAPGKRSQTYMYMRTRFYQLSEVGNDQGACLVPALYDTSDGNGESGEWAEFSRIGGSGVAFTYLQEQTISKHGWYAFKSMIQNMINQMVLSQDRGTIYGDILKAYGADKIYAMPEIDNTYTVFPQYNAEVLTEIENITVSRTYNPLGLFQLAVDQPNRLFVGQTPNWNVTSVASIGYMPTTQILNMHMEGQPTPEIITIATRHKVGGTVLSKERSATIVSGSGKPVPINQSTGGYTENAISVSKDPVTTHLPSSAGSEVVNAVYMSRFTYEGSTTEISTLSVNTLYPYDSGTTTYYMTSADRWLRLMSFDWHPFIYSTTYDSTIVIGDGLAVPHDVWGDYDNYIEINDVELSKINEAAFYVLYGIPQF